VKQPTKVCVLVSPAEHPADAKKRFLQSAETLARVRLMDVSLQPANEKCLVQMPIKRQLRVESSSAYGSRKESQKYFLKGLRE
jgi:hypothetical protein